MSISTKVTLELEPDEAQILWWAVWEKAKQMGVRIDQYKKSGFLPEAISQYRWECDKLNAILDKIRKTEE